MNSVTPMPAPGPDDDEVVSLSAGDVRMYESASPAEPIAQAESVCVHSVLVEHGGPDDPGDPTHRPSSPERWAQIVRYRLPS